MIDRRHLAALFLASAALLAACGGDDEDTASEPSSVAATTAPPTAPPATTPVKKPKPAKPAPATPAPPGCVREPRFIGLKFSGTPCAQAYAIAAAWEKMANDCNTIDDPESPEGYKRTCEVEGYTCNTKRITTSEARKVACSSGTALVKFRWEP